MGADFTRLWAASAVSNLGDGVTLVAGPLLVASLTRDPALVAGAAFVQQLPWLLFSLISGVYVDRLDRRRLIVAVNLLRGLVIAALAGAIATGIAAPGSPALAIALIYAAFFLLGTGETIVDTAAAARLPGLVPAQGLATANARLMATFTLGNQFLAKPLGAYLFVLAPAVPFGFDAVTFVFAAVLVAFTRSTADVPGPDARVRPGRGKLRDDIGEGVRWLWGHALLRTLAFSMGTGNVAFCGAFAIFVLYARERLHLSEVGYGYLLVTFAVGGLIGTLSAARLQRRLGAAMLLRAGLIIEAATHAALALITDYRQAVVVLVVFGVHTMVWGTIVTTLVQRSAPDRLRGRVTGVYGLVQVGGAAVGSLSGGVFARGLGITAPFWIAAVVMTLTAVLAWRPLRAAR